MTDKKHPTTTTAPTTTRKAHGTPPDTSLILGDVRKAWLESHGGATQFIRDAIDAAMAAEADRDNPYLLSAAELAEFERRITY
jgi:hypothetical protein